MILTTFSVGLETDLLVLTESFGEHVLALAGLIVVDLDLDLDCLAPLGSNLEKIA